MSRSESRLRQSIALGLGILGGAGLVLGAYFGGQGIGLLIGALLRVAL